VRCPFLVHIRAQERLWLTVNVNDYPTSMALIEPSSVLTLDDAFNSEENSLEGDQITMAGLFLSHSLDQR
jgi:hypothetical protein